MPQSNSPPHPLTLTVGLPDIIFYRTVDTSTRLLGNKQIPIKVEPGFCEVFPIFIYAMWKNAICF